MTSVEIAQAYIALTVKAPALTKGVNSALAAVDSDGAGRKIGEGLGGGISKTSAAIAGAVGGIVSAVAQKGMDALGGLIGEAITASDATDKFAQTLSFAGLDTSAIDTAMSRSKAYADSTVYDLGTIQNTTAQLAANGIGNYSDLTEAAGNLNAVAGGNANTFSSVAMMLTQTAGAGKLTTENWNQLADAIPGASGRLQAAMASAGAYTGNFRDAMEKGEITADEFNAAILALGTEPVAVEAASSVTTFEGAIGNLQATITGGLASALNAMKPMLTGAISGLAAAAGTVFTGFSAMWAAMAEGDVTSDGAVGVFESVGVALRSVGEAVAPLLPALIETWSALSPLGAAFQLLQPLLPLLLDAFTQIASALTGALAPILPVIAGLLSQIGQTLAGALGAILPVVIPIIVQLVTTLAGLAAKVLPMLLPVIAQLAQLLGQAAAAAAPIISALVNALVPIIDALVPIVISLTSAFMPLITTLVGALAPILTLVANILAAVLVPILNVVVWVIQLVAGVIVWLIDVIGDLVGAVVWMGANWDLVVAAISAVWDGFITWLTQIMVNLVTWWNGIWAGIGQFVTDVWNGFVNWVVGIFIGLYNTLVSVGAGISGWWNGLWSGIGDFFAGIWNGFVGIVRDVWNGIIGWIESGVNGAIDLINGLLGAADVVLGVIGIDVAPLSHVGIPRMATGGIIERSTTGTLALIGEGGRDEAVIPLPDDWKQNGLQGRGPGGPVTQNFYAQSHDPRIAIRQMAREAWTAFA